MATLKNHKLALLKLKDPAAFEAYMLELVRLYGGEIKLIAKMLAIHRNTVTRWVQDSPALRSAVEDARALSEASRP
jgi:transposase